MQRSLRLLSFIIIIFLQGCTPTPRPIDESPGERFDYSPINYMQLSERRARLMYSSAYLIDLRVNNQGQHYDVTTEVYFSGDSIGVFGRGYLGKGTFRGHVIDDRVKIYFPDANEYVEYLLSELTTAGECAGPGEVMMYMLTLLSGKSHSLSSDQQMGQHPDELVFKTGRFTNTVYLKSAVDDQYPRREMYLDHDCDDSIVIGYRDFSREHPFYKINDILYYNERLEFRARGFMREQKYNIDIDERKFVVQIPAGAIRLDSF